MFLDNVPGQIECDRTRRVSCQQKARQEALHKVRISKSVSAAVSRPCRDDEGVYLLT